MHHVSWKLVDAARTRIAWFGSDAMVFNPTTWHTHLVIEAAGIVIEALKEMPRSDANLRSLLGLDATADDEAALQELLTTLADCTLVEPVSDDR